MQSEKKNYQFNMLRKKKQQQHLNNNQINIQINIIPPKFIFAYYITSYKQSILSMDDDKQVWQDRQQKYFEQKKKGEINEIKNMLNKIINEPDDKKGRQVMKKVIGYMTLGLDASPIFSEMCRASFTNDEIQKKMIYFYLTTYAEENPDLSVMVINTFKKDCKHSKPKIRGMALRNLCNFKTVDYVDNVLPLLREALMDHESYVKKTAVFGCLKLFYFDNEAVLGDDQIMDKLSALIKDSDSIVSFNALVALNEIKIAQGGIPMSPKLTMYLLNRLEEYNQWGQTTILEYVYKYNPKDDKQLFEILNILETRLKNSCTALVFAAIKIFLKYTLQKEHLFTQVIERIKSPLLTLMTSSYNNGTFQTSYVILEHILDVIINMKGKTCFENDFKYFYFRADEPTYLKDIKLKILTELASENNLGDMLNEINEYALDPNVETSRRAIQSLAIIALKLKDVTKALMKNLVEFYRSNKTHLVNQSVIAFQQILRKSPREFSEIKEHIQKQKQFINEQQSLFSFMWILGSFGEQIKSAPYIIESIMSTPEEFQKLSPKLQGILLTSTVTLFLKRAPEMLPILQKILGYIFKNQHISVDLKDRASFYYRSMQANIEDVKKGFLEIRQDLTIVPPKVSKITANIDQFNTLSLIYKKPQHKFIKPYEYFLEIRHDNRPNKTQYQTEQVEEEQRPDPFEERTLQPEDIFESNQYTVSQDDYQTLWQSMDTISCLSKTTKEQDVINSQNMEELFKMWRIYLMAEGGEDDNLQIYFYSKHSSGVLVCFELMVDKSEHTLTLNTKCESQSIANMYNRYIEEFLTLNDITQ